jgi:hypothetical protein
VHHCSATGNGCPKPDGTQKFPLSGQTNVSAVLQTNVRPHLEFAVPAWSPWLKGDIERVQEEAVKMVAGLRTKEKPSFFSQRFQDQRKFL